MGSRQRDEYGLTDQQRRFANEYLISENGAASYRKIYKGVSIKSSQASAPRLLAHVRVRAYIKMRQEAVHKEMAKKYNVSVERIYKELARLSFYSTKDFITEDGELIPVSELSEDAAAVVEGFDTHGYKLPGKGPNLDKLMKAVGMFEKHNQQQQIIIRPPEVFKPDNAGT